MTLVKVFDEITKSLTWQQITKAIKTESTYKIAAPNSLFPVITNHVATQSNQVVLAVTSNSREAEELSNALKLWNKDLSIAVFPSWETLPHEKIAPTSDIVGQRLAVIRRLTNPDERFFEGKRIDVVIAPVRSLMQPILKTVADIEPLALQVGDEIDLLRAVTHLVEIGYERVEMVERRGHIAVRGGILDVFVPGGEHPLRVEFFGDDVEEIRYFSVADQRSLEIAPHGLWAPACYEPYLNEEFAPVGQLQIFTDLFPENSVVLFSDYEKVRTRASEVLKTAEEFLNAAWISASLGGKIPQEVLQGGFRELSEIEKSCLKNNLKTWQVSPFIGHVEDDKNFDVIDLKVKVLDGYRGDFTSLVTDLRNKLSLNWQIIIASAGAGISQRYLEQFSQVDVPARITNEEISQNLLNLFVADIQHGFSLPEQKIIVISDTDIIGIRSTTKDSSKLPTKRKNSIDVLTLVPGNYIVHEQHGVGKYVEMMSRTVGNATREYLVIEYSASKRGQPADRLFVPTDQLDQVTKFIGGEAPSLNRLGGIDWEKTKGRARKAVKEIAAELIRLYAARQASPGFTFSADTPWQRELEDSFAYVETPDQLSCINEVKKDMEKSVPMDRVIAGDVGYGKTEIAVRAAFKAVQDGKQVAILVPTTLLVQQHFTTFSQRYAPFPIKINALSRFQSTKEINETLAGIAEGSVDVIIGTHRLLTADVRFKDLGLVIVDEEQRFGVEHKEHLKALKTNVDFLTMTATPIPRTLEMSLTGIREMSLIQTPPEDRLPVLTFVGAFDKRQVAAAIRRELLRDGQVFYVHNRVSSIDKTVSELRELVPEATFAVAHGQMNEHQLEQVILDFWAQKFDVLVSTTIVESGLDIPNANTLIVDRADTFGLSQLHQIRGRVGRAKERAYAYFFYPVEKPLSENAYDRLATIAQHTDLGSGMAVALKDLEIRGAGNILGGQQSGHIAEVGFDLYVRLVGEALSVAKGEAPKVDTEIKIELSLDAHLPHDYIKEERLRMQIYRRLAEVKEESDVNLIAEELLDRFGKFGSPVEILLQVAKLRVLARRVGVSEIVQQAKYIRIAPMDLPDSRIVRLNRLYPGTQVRATVRSIQVPSPTTSLVNGAVLKNEEILNWINQVIANIFEDELKEKNNEAEVS
jgi:transcription-repair coupling factor (superfamily II helicase)